MIPPTEYFRDPRNDANRTDLQQDLARSAATGLETELGSEVRVDEVAVDPDMALTVTHHTKIFGNEIVGVEYVEPTMPVKISLIDNDDLFRRAQLTGELEVD